MQYSTVTSENRTACYSKGNFTEQSSNFEPHGIFEDVCIRETLHMTAGGL